MNKNIHTIRRKKRIIRAFIWSHLFRDRNNHIFMSHDHSHHNLDRWFKKKYETTSVGPTLWVYQNWTYTPLKPLQKTWTLNLFSQKKAKPRPKSRKTELQTLPNSGSSTNIRWRFKKWILDYNGTDILWGVLFMGNTLILP